jgi:hypothetical protein
MNEIVLKRVAASLLRHALTGLGAVLVTRGLTTEADFATLVTDLTPLLVGLGWSVYEKRWKPRTPAT